MSDKNIRRLLTVAFVAVWWYLGAPYPTLERFLGGGFLNPAGAPEWAKAEMGAAAGKPVAAVAAPTASTEVPTSARPPYITSDRRSIAYGRNDCYLVDGQIECPLRAGE